MHSYSSDLINCHRPAKDRVAVRLPSFHGAHASAVTKMEAHRFGFCPVAHFSL
eukprot:COSAG05_NODE_868_length_6866_cov_131.011231_4_plen_53_part_00